MSYSFPSNSIDALAYLFIQKNSSATSPKELVQEFLDAKNEVEKSLQELDPDSHWLL